MLEVEKSSHPTLFYSKHLVVMFTTGPGIVNKTYSKYKYKYKVRSLPWKFFQPFGTRDDVRTLNLDPEVFAMHASKGTWAGQDTEIINIIHREWKILVLILCLFLVPMFYGILRLVNKG